MSMIGEMYRISRSRLQELLDDPTLIQGELYPDDYPANCDIHGCNVDKAWDAIEFVLYHLAESGIIPLVAPLTGGTKTGCVLHYGPVLYRSPDEVADIADILAGISREEFHDCFKPELMSEHNCYPAIWREEDWHELFDYVWQQFDGMARIYRAAADQGDALLLHIA